MAGRALSDGVMAGALQLLRELPHRARHADVLTLDPRFASKLLQLQLGNVPGDIGTISDDVCTAARSWLQSDDMGTFRVVQLLVHLPGH